MKNSLLIVAILFPLFIMAGWLGSLIWDRANGVELEFSIVGYDPRDPWSGHYLTYSVDYGLDKICKEIQFKQPMCLCLSVPANGELSKGTSLESCDTAVCPVFLRGRCRYDRFIADIERFYFSENYVDQLQVVPPKSTIKVSVSPSGSALVKALYIDGKSLPEWIADNTAQR